METDNLVTEPTSGQVSPETLPAGSVPQGGTLPKGADDVEKKLQELTQKYEKDIDNLKSSLQRNEAELKRQLEQQKAAYDQFVRDSKLKSMDETERKKFEEQELIERNRSYEEEAKLAKQALAERDQKDQYRDFFISVGVNPQELDMAGDLTTFVNSGYAAWSRKTKALEKKLAELEKKAQAGDEEPTPPDVDTTKGKPSGGNTWPTLIKQYGSAEKVYRKIELGELPASILPPT